MLFYMQHVGRVAHLGCTKFPDIKKPQITVNAMFF